MTVPLVRLGRAETSSLGVVMMAGAVAFGALGWCAAVVGVVDELCSMSVSEERTPGLLGRADAIVCVVAVALTVARAIVGYQAGRALATGRDARALLGTYAAIGLGHAGAVAAIVAPTWTPVEVASVAATLSALPVIALAILPRASSPGGRGADAVPALALLAGLVAVVLAVALALSSWDLTAAGVSAAGDRYALVPPLQVLLILGTALGMIAVALAIAIGVVGALMLRAGLHGLRGGGEVAIDQATRAAGFVGFVIAVALSILVVTAVAIPAIVGLAMAFPQLLRRASLAPPAPDPDARRDVLGWMLLGHGALATAALAPAALAHDHVPIVAGIVAAPATSPAIGVALALVELGAAVLLLRRAPVARLMTVLWSFAGLAVAALVGGVVGLWVAIVPVLALVAGGGLTETLRARARLVRSFSG